MIHLRTLVLLLIVVALPFAAITVSLAQSAAPPPTEIPFVSHLQAGMNEQDVFVAIDGYAYRVPADADPGTATPLYAAAEAVEHNPGSLDDIGPYALGVELGVTQAAWLAGGGTFAFGCSEGRGDVRAGFTNLVPDATYTLWQSFVATPVTVPFKALDLPLGAFDGSQNVFTTDAAGNAEFRADLDACLPLSEPMLTSVVAIAYHSDGRTHGIEPGVFGLNSHVQLVAFLPAAD